MERASNAMQGQKKEDAQTEGKQAHSKLMAMMDEMQQQLSKMKGADQEQIEREMRMAMQDCNNLSKSQEDLLREAAAMNPSSLSLRDMAARQQELMAACAGLKNRISELGKQSPFVAMELQQLVSGATQDMDLATQGCANRRGHEAAQRQRNAMSQLNRAAVRMMESLDQQKQCDKGGSCDKQNQKLQSLCNKQNKLNQETQSQCNKPGGQNSKPSGSENGRQAMQRLAGEQASIRKSLQDLADEFGNSREVLGRLDDIAREMTEIEEAMSSGNVGPETTERQLKIYSRMLEASRSLQRRDFTEQRKAAAATSPGFVSPPELPRELLDERVSLEDRLRKYLSGDYPPQYEEQIKAYFKALLEAESRLRGGQERP